MFKTEVHSMCQSLFIIIIIIINHHQINSRASAPVDVWCHLHNIVPTHAVQDRVAQSCRRFPHHWTISSAHSLWGLPLLFAPFIVQITKDLTFLSSFIWYDQTVLISWSAVSSRTHRHLHWWLSVSIIIEVYFCNMYFRIAVISAWIHLWLSRTHS